MKDRLVRAFPFPLPRAATGLSLAALLCTGCNSTTEPEPTPSARITPENFTIAGCNTIKMTASIVATGRADIAPDSVWWSTSDAEKARFTAGDTLLARLGTIGVTIRAVTFSQGSVYTATTRVTIMDPSTSC